MQGHLNIIKSGCKLLNATMNHRKRDTHKQNSGVESRGAGAPPEFGGSEKGQSLIYAYRSLAITASPSGFEKLSTALPFYICDGIPFTEIRENLHDVDISSTPYLPYFVNVICERLLMTLQCTFLIRKKYVKRHKEQKFKVSIT